MLMEVLQRRFEGNMHRHPGLNWEDVRARLEANPEKLQALKAMEETGESQM